MKRTAHLYQLYLNMAYLTIIIITNNICPTIRVLPLMCQGEMRVDYFQNVQLQTVLNFFTMWMNA